MWYKTLHKRLTCLGWTISKEYKNGPLCVVEYLHTKTFPFDNYGTFTIHAFPKKDGSPGQVFFAGVGENSRAKGILF